MTTDTLPSFGEFALMRLARAKKRKEANALQVSNSYQAFIRIVLHLAGFALLTIAGFTFSMIAGYVIAGFSCFVLSTLMTAPSEGSRPERR